MLIEIGRGKYEQLVQAKKTIDSFLRSIQPKSQRWVKYSSLCDELQESGITVTRAQIHYAAQKLGPKAFRKAGTRNEYDVEVFWDWFTKATA